MTMNNKCIKFLQMYAFWSWLVVLASFILSFACVIVDERWVMVSWVLPSLVILISISVFAIPLAYYLFVTYKKNRVLTLHFFEKEYKIYENKFICLLGKILLGLMLVTYVLLLYPILITLVAYLILLIINNILNKKNT